MATGRQYKTLAELEQECPEAFRNPVVSDADWDAKMARNRARAEAEEARAAANPPDDEEEEEEEEDEDGDEH